MEALDKVLEKALAKAKENGYVLPYSLSSSLLKEMVKDKSYYSLVFTQEFAESLWHELGTCTSSSFAPWQIHLMKMASARNPLVYLGEWLEES